MERERGFIVIQRQIQSSPIWLSLRGDQRMVLLSILLLANWTPGRARWKGRWYEVRRGELADTMANIAEHANTSLAVVRSTVDALLGDDTDVGGNGPFLAQRYPISNTGPSTGPRVLTVVNYNKYQDVEDAPNTGTNPDLTPGSNTGLTQASHRPHTGLAQIEPSKPDQPSKPTSERESGAAARHGLTALPTYAEKFPATAAVIARLAERRIFVKFSKDHADRAAIETDIAQATTGVAADRIASAHALDPHTGIGWFANAIRGRTTPPAKQNRGPVPSSTDFTSPEASTL